MIFCFSFVPLVCCFGLYGLSVAKISRKFAACAKFCDCWRSNVEFQTHVNPFLPSVLFVAGAIFAPGRSLCRTLCALFVGGLHLIWSALIRWTNFWEGLSESSKFVARTAVGDDSVCHSVRTEEEASSCSSLHQQALAACIWGMVLLLPLGSKQKQTKKKNKKTEMRSQCRSHRGCWIFAFPGTQCWVPCPNSNSGTVMADCSSK